MMVGDGLNDSLAIAEVACAGTPAIDRPFLASRCDFYLVSPGLRAIVDAFDVARRLARTVQTDLAIAVAYNVVVVAVSFAGWMRPWLAAVLMPASSIATIAFTTLAMRGGRGTQEPTGRRAWTS
jgi:Cu2+-exporting ATPase